MNYFKDLQRDKAFNLFQNILYLIDSFRSSNVGLPRVTLTIFGGD